MDTRFWAQASRSLGRHIRSSRRGFVTEVLTAGLRADQAPRAQTRHIFEAFPGSEGLPVDIGQVIYRRSNMDPYEQFALATISRLRQPKRVFEIGTFDGATTVLLARMLPDAQFWTLDLSPDVAGVASEADEARNASNSGVGVRFRDTAEGARISQLFGDSRTFDFSPWYESIDLVLVDGGHEYDVVKSDTENASQLVAPRGLIVWDDYSRAWPGVVRAVDESPMEAFHLAATEFAIYAESSQ